ncbi:unnamed protein product [Prorocentrum cordatum]|uniref:Methyltransferase domain-containing protein n=1 Tax=Prorocentrum cordatum TaxID=2364126 RepID=A0ABN9YE42_9DINO|nr:unnamed protein product [Polarella glacialis]
MPTEARAFELLASSGEARRLPHRGRGSELRVLDFGCGDGRYLPLYLRVAGALREALGASLRVVAYDISTEALRAFRSRAEEAGLRRVGGAGSGPDVLALGALSVHFVLGDGAAELGAVRESLLKAGPVFDLVVVGWGTLSSVPRLPGISPAGLLELFAQMGHAILRRIFGRPCLS